MAIVRPLRPGRLCRGRSHGRGAKRARRDGTDDGDPGGAGPHAHSFAPRPWPGRGSIARGGADARWPYNAPRACPGHHIL